MAGGCCQKDMDGGSVLTAASGEDLLCAGGLLLREAAGIPCYMRRSGIIYCGSAERRGRAQGGEGGCEGLVMSQKNALISICSFYPKSWKAVWAFLVPLSRRKLELQNVKL